MTNYKQKKSTTKTIFLVDDFLTSLVEAEEALSDLYDLYTFSSAAQMFSLVETIMPDLILLDVLMPEMDGFEALQALKANSKLIHIPVFFLTSVSDESLEIKGLSMGAVDFIHKPFSAPLLRKRIDLHLTMEAHKRELVAFSQDMARMVDVQVAEKIKIHNSYKQYLDPIKADMLYSGHGGPDDRVVGEVRDIAVLFVDVRGFTTMTESLKNTPEVVIKALNELFELCTQCIFDNGGSVDKFIGDAIMALFNGYVTQDDYIYKSVKAAYEMVNKSLDLLTSIEEYTGNSVAFGVGVHCGKAIVGNVGSTFRKDYTAIGDTVNVASRLESNAGWSEILISKSVVDALEGRINVEAIGELLLKGRKETVEVYSLYGVL